MHKETFTSHKVKEPTENYILKFIEFAKDKHDDPTGYSSKVTTCSLNSASNKTTAIQRGNEHFARLGSCFQSAIEIITILISALRIPRATCGTSVTLLQNKVGRATSGMGLPASRHGGGGLRATTSPSTTMQSRLSVQMRRANKRRTGTAVIYVSIEIVGSRY